MAPYLRLRQLCLVAADLEGAAADLTDVLGLSVCHRDPNVGKYGLANVLMPVATSFIEVVAPKEPGPGTAAGRYLARRRGDGGYMVILDSEAVAPWRAHMEANGVRRVEDRNVEGKADLMQLHPRDTGGCILEIDHHVGGEDPHGPYQWAGEHWHEHVRADRALAVTAAELQSDLPEALAQRWSVLLRRPAQATGGGWRLALDNAELRFVAATDGRGEGLGGIDLAVRDTAPIIAAARARGLTTTADSVLLRGVRFRLATTPWATTPSASTA